MVENAVHKLAVLIDAENAQATVCSELLAEVSRFGTATVKRAYGDWTTTNLKGWKAHLHQHAVQPIQQFSYTQGKNSTDSSLIIDAMDLLHQGGLDGFCLVSSDSDFTRLANRIRESGLFVYGFGEKKTPQAFVAACDKFVYTEVLRGSRDEEKSDKSGNRKLRAILSAAIEAMSKDDGWAPLSSVGSHINKNMPSFDARNYGYSKLGELVKSLSYLKVKKESVGDSSSNMQIYVKEIGA